MLTNMIPQKNPCPFQLLHVGGHRFAQDELSPETGEKIGRILYIFFLMVQVDARNGDILGIVSLFEIIDNDGAVRVMRVW
jgi:hypothetical protein